MKYDYVAIFLGIVCMGVGCKTETRAPAENAAPKPVITYPAMGKLERLDPQFDALIPPTATIEKLAEGYDWSEGPVWIRAGGYLLFSDVPMNTVYSWKEGDGAHEAEYGTLHVRLRVDACAVSHQRSRLHDQPARGPEARPIHRNRRRSPQIELVQLSSAV